MNIKDLKVGDVVFIREDLEFWQIYGNLIYYPEMHTRLVRVEYVSTDYFRIHQDEVGYLYSAEMIDWDETIRLRWVESLLRVYDEEYNQDKQDNVHNPDHYGGVESTI